MNQADYSIAMGGLRGKIAKLEADNERLRKRYEGYKFLGDYEKLEADNKRLRSERDKYKFHVERLLAGLEAVKAEKA